MSTLKPISKFKEWPLNSCHRVRWIGSNGGWQLGLIVAADADWCCVLNEHTRTVSRVTRDQFEYDNPKDDAGNLK